MSHDNFFREVDEELRSERMRKLWRRFAPYIIGAAIAVVLAVAINEGWAWWQNSNSARASDEFYVALEKADAGDIAGAQAALDAIEAQGSGGYSVLARFKDASLLASSGERDEAAAAYDALATDLNNVRLRELALLLAANLLVDQGDVAAVQSRVNGIAVDGNPLRNAAREAVGLTQYKAGDLQGARATFETITADPLVSQNIAGRVQIYLAQLAAEGAAASEDDAAEASVDANPVASPDATTAQPEAGEAIDEAPAMSAEPAPVEGQPAAN